MAIGCLFSIDMKRKYAAGTEPIALDHFLEGPIVYQGGKHEFSK